MTNTEQWAAVWILIPLAYYMRHREEMFAETLHRYNRNYNPLSGIFIDEMIKDAFGEEVMKAGQRRSLTLDP